MIKRAYFFTKNFLFDLLFPRTCLGCGEEGSWICKKCLGSIDIIKQPFCPECRRPTLVGEFCENCRSRFMLDGIFICANFGEGILKEAIHHFKYNHIFDIGEILGKIMAGKLKNAYGTSWLHAGAWSQHRECKFPRYDLQEYPEFGPPEFDLVVPVPLHKKRLRERGFNQAEILAKEIVKMHRGTSRFKAGALNQHITPTGNKIILAKNILIRKKYTIPQAELDREQRLNNLKDVFVIGAYCNTPLQGKDILLVDDVTTTGATLEECAKILKANGARSVWGIVLAKGK